MALSVIVAATVVGGAAAIIALALYALLRRPRAAPPSHIIIVRHGEKQSTDGALSDVGRARALALTAWARDVVPRRYTDGAPLAAVYTTLPLQDGADMRPRQTAEPLAFDLALPLFGTQRYCNVRGAACELLGNASLAARPVLVVWEHTSIQALVAELTRALGGAKKDGGGGGGVNNDAATTTLLGAPAWNERDYATVLVIDNTALATRGPVLRRSCEMIGDDDAAMCQLTATAGIGKQQDIARRANCM